LNLIFVYAHIGANPQKTPSNIELKTHAHTPPYAWIAKAVQYISRRKKMSAKDIQGSGRDGEGAGGAVVILLGL
jgi:hypothetical protein